MSDENYVNGKIRTVIGIVFGDNTLSTYDTNKYTLSSQFICDNNDNRGITITEQEIDDLFTSFVLDKLNLNQV